MGLDAGKLRHVVDFEVRDEEQDSDEGGITTTWSTIFTEVRASIEPVSVSSFVAAAAEQSKVVAKITVRHRAGMNAAQRIVHGRSCCAETLDVEYFNPEGFLRDKETGLEYVTIPCSQGTNEG